MSTIRRGRRPALTVHVVVGQTRVQTGQHVVAEVVVRNAARSSVPSVVLDLPVGTAVPRFDVPPLAPGGEFREVVVLPTRRRGVHVVGPATAIRVDRFGLARRVVTRTDPVELLVHPCTVRLNPLGSGLLEPFGAGGVGRGAPSRPSRPTHPALRASRGHLAVVVDCVPANWLHPDEFETAVEVAASVAVRAQRDGTDLSVAGGRLVGSRLRGPAALDLLCRFGPAFDPVPAVAERLARTLDGVRCPAGYPAGYSTGHPVSGVVVVAGALTTLEALHRTAAALGADVPVAAIRVEHGAPLTPLRSDRLTVVTIGSLVDLQRVVSGALP